MVLFLGERDSLITWHSTHSFPNATMVLDPCRILVDFLDI